MKIAIVGAGIAGLSLALQLHKLGLACDIFESANDIKELGVGITLLPHATRELTSLDLHHKLPSLAIENKESVFFNRFGQRIYSEPRGVLAGYEYPEFGIHRGKLHKLLYVAALERVGRERIRLSHSCIRVEQGEMSATLQFARTGTSEPLPPFAADVVIACDGINSAIRKSFYPNESIGYSGINTWRGVTRRPPILGGRSYMRIGSIRTGKLVVYPIVDDVDGQGNQLINWMAEIQTDSPHRNEWNRHGRIEDFLPIYQDWTFDWLDVPAMIRDADLVLEYPMVDRDPVERWTFGRVTLAGDAAHPMYPRGSNGSAQAMIDARTLADCLAKHGDVRDALREYEGLRLGPTSRIVMTNRSHPPDVINIRVEELTKDRPFDRLSDFISEEELRALSDDYKKIAGFSLADLRR
jgi:2-polyprenyl-6-methoxyphenol hydroxylase-like FAD-dependent oxidoreductase